MVSTAAPAPAPGALESVRQFVNTFDVETDTDQIDHPDGLRRWLAAHGLQLDGSLGSRDVQHAATLREALRDALAANHDRADIPADARRVLNGGIARARLTLEVTPDRRWRTTAAARGIDGALGSLLTVVVGAMADGSWDRLKVCANDRCRWAFYDHSRARTGKWCSMRICGNRVKQQSWRDRHATR